MRKSQRNSEVNPKPGQLELAAGSPGQESQEGLPGDAEPGALLVDREGSEQGKTEQWRETQCDTLVRLPNTEGDLCDSGLLR